MLKTFKIHLKILHKQVANTPYPPNSFDKPSSAHAQAMDRHSCRDWNLDEN